MAYWRCGNSIIVFLCPPAQSRGREKLSKVLSNGFSFITLRVELSGEVYCYLSCPYVYNGRAACVCVCVCGSVTTII